MPTNESGEAHTLAARLRTSAAPSQAGRKSYPQPAIAAMHRAGTLRGAYLFEPDEMQDATQRFTLLGSGAILTEAVKAAASLRALGIGV
jgi:pyruvate dehydrogenase complex dehydrogenase (E1) component